MLQTRVDRLQGADPATLESKVRQYYGSDDAGDEDSAVAGHVSAFATHIHYLLPTLTLYKFGVRVLLMEVSCLQT